MVALAAWLWRVTPGSLVPDEDQGYYIAAVILPDGATLQRTDKVVGEVLEAIRSNPNNKDVVAFTGFDFLGGELPQQRGDAVRDAEALERAQGRHAAADRRLLHEDRAHQARRWCSPSVRRRSSAWATRAASSSTSRTAATAGRRRSPQALGRFLAAANKDPMLGGVQTLWRASVPQLARGRRSRQGRGARGAAGERSTARSPSTLGTYYVNDFNKYGRTWQVLMSAAPGYRDAPRRHRQGLGALGQGRDDSALGARAGALHRRGRTRSTASTTCPR